MFSRNKNRVGIITSIILLIMIIIAIIKIKYNRKWSLGLRAVFLPARRSFSQLWPGCRRQRLPESKAFDNDLIMNNNHNNESNHTL